MVDTYLVGAANVHGDSLPEDHHGGASDDDHDDHASSDGSDGPDSTPPLPLSQIWWDVMGKGVNPSAVHAPVGKGKRPPSEVFAPVGRWWGTVAGKGKTPPSEVFAPVAGMGTHVLPFGAPGDPGMHPPFVAPVADKGGSSGSNTPETQHPPQNGSQYGNDAESMLGPEDEGGLDSGSDSEGSVPESQHPLPWNCPIL